jgi:hypothetical protein
MNSLHSYPARRSTNVYPPNELSDTFYVNVAFGTQLVEDKVLITGVKILCSQRNGFMKTGRGEQHKQRTDSNA